MPIANNDEFRRGHIAGEINARLAGHDAHFLKINGSIDASKAAMENLAMQVQRLADQAIARDATVLTTATALEKADTARRAKSEQSWSHSRRSSRCSGRYSPRWGCTSRTPCALHPVNRSGRCGSGN